METEQIIQPAEVGIRHELGEKLALAKELGLDNQVQIIARRLRHMDFEQTNPYPEVTFKDGQRAMCGKPIEKESDIKKVVRCKHMLNNHSWHEIVTGKQIELIYPLKLLSGALQLYAQELPMSVLLRLKEATAKGFFDWFEVWRPVSKEDYRQLIDPWLVGRFDEKYYKIADWR